jgi:asparagine synthase (glutamine-hydrolysing)
MCGIFASYGEASCLCECQPPYADVTHALDQLKARGPEGTQHMIPAVHVNLGFTRLAINGLSHCGMQPFSSLQGRLHVVCNGEIYNHVALAAKHNILNISCSDCEVLGPLFDKLNDPVAWAQSLDGVFAIALYDSATDRLYVARDPFGVRPLYYGYYYSATDSDEPKKTIVFASEIKALTPYCQDIEAFPPGHVGYYHKNTLRIKRFHSVPTEKNPQLVCNPHATMATLKTALESAVQKRLMTERPVAALLSGGVDSSLIAALVQKNLNALGKPPLETFSIGFAGSPDLHYARLVAQHIGSKHHEIIATPDEFFKAIPEVIRNIESFDITTVRASVGNWLVAKAIREQSDCKVVFNGDGADEVFGSYLYFYNAPSDEAFESECTRLLETIHHFDVLRSDRCISSHGLEPRTPFLDKGFVAVARSIPTVWRRPIMGVRPEKGILRKAFEADGLLPEEVLWRRKEAFSDGVSEQKKSWYEEIQERLRAVTEMPAMGLLAEMFPHMTPQTLEAYYYRIIYITFFGEETATQPYFWLPRWCGDAMDPSARTLASY